MPKNKDYDSSEKDTRISLLTAQRDNMEHLVDTLRGKTLDDFDLRFEKMPDGYSFKYYNSYPGRDIIAGEGGTLFAKIIDHRCLHESLVEKRKYHGYFRTEHNVHADFEYYVGEHNGEMSLIKEADIRIIPPKKKAKK